ncbi:hypothetical protein FKM82_027793 [Ascaphus truei]
MLSRASGTYTPALGADLEEKSLFLLVRSKHACHVAHVSSVKLADVNFDPTCFVRLRVTSSRVIIALGIGCFYSIAVTLIGRIDLLFTSTAIAMIDQCTCQSHLTRRNSLTNIQYIYITEVHLTAVDNTDITYWYISKL